MIQVLLGLAASLTITFGSTTGSATGNKTLDLLLTIFWIVGITNALNFFDNLDGGAAVASFMSALGLFLYSTLTNQPYLASFGVILMGVMLGFFIWNRRPAKIYMGDSGALFLGMLLATIAVRIDPQTDSRWAAFSVPIFLLALPILDTSTVVISRVLNKRSPLQGGKDHLSHRLATKGLRHRYILYLFAGISTLFQAPIFLYLQLGKSTEYFVLSLFLVFMIFTWTFFSRIQIKYENH
jgi:UDP-GlcNAc:undecaprenyl-phosphate GlcNAc-1-phosphate transferase